MRAIVFEGEGRWSLSQRSEPVITEPNEVQVAVESCGICGTDLHILETPPGHPATPGTILGHEFVGYIQAVGEAVDHLEVGQRVVVDPVITCRYCPYCQTGQPNYCQNMDALGVFRHGAFADFVVAPAGNCHPIDAAVPAAQAALVEPLACVLNGVHTAQIRPGESVLIQGFGPIGALFTKVLKLNGAQVLVSEPSPYRAERAGESGAGAVFDPKSSTFSEDVKAASGGIGPDVVVDAVGTLLATSIDLVRRGGRIILFGMNEQALPPIRQNTITRHGIRINGTYIAPFKFPAAVRLVESGRLNLDTVITHQVQLDEFGLVLAELYAGQGLKASVAITAR